MVLNFKRESVIGCFAAAMFAVSALAVAEETATPVEMLGGHPVYGASMPRDGDVVTVAAALSKPDAYIGQPGKFSGQITEVCQRKGCWVVLAVDDAYLRVTFKDYDFFVPKDSSGKALVYGTLEQTEVVQSMAEHLASEGDTRVLESDGQEYRLIARSIMIKKS